MLVNGINRFWNVAMSMRKCQNMLKEKAVY